MQWYTGDIDDEKPKLRATRLGLLAPPITISNKVDASIRLTLATHVGSVGSILAVRVERTSKQRATIL